MQSKGFCDFSCEHVFNLIPVQLMLQPYKLLGYQKKSMLFEGFKPLHVMFFCPKKNRHPLSSRNQSWYLLTKDFSISPQNS